MENLLGIFLYGSQNYKCELENSDVDTKAIYIPNLTEAIMDKPKIKNYILPNGEHCELMDIRHFVNNLYKQNINFVEILYTNYFWLNYKYKNLWLIHFKANKEAIAHYDVPRGIASVIGQTKHTLNQNPRSGKKIGNSYRLLWFLQKYAAGAPYKEALILDEEKRNRIKELKNIEELENELKKEKLANKILLAICSVFLLIIAYLWHNKTGEGSVSDNKEVVKDSTVISKEKTYRLEVYPKTIEAQSTGRDSIVITWKDNAPKVKANFADKNEWVKEVSKNENSIVVCVEKNETGKEREAIVEFVLDGQKEKVNIKQAAH